MLERAVDDVGHGFEAAVGVPGGAFGLARGVFHLAHRVEVNEWIEVGEGSNVQDNSTCHTDRGYPLTIGQNCTVGHNVILHGCTLEDGALVGMGSIVMNGARIGRGSIVPLMELGTGFEGEFSGRENIFLNGALLGRSRAQIRTQMDAIISFAGLEEFIDSPLRTYSTGMVSRLAFAIQEPSGEYAT